MALFFTVIVGIILVVEYDNQLNVSTQILSETTASSAEYAVKTKNTEELHRLICVILSLSKDTASIQILDIHSDEITRCDRKSFTPSESNFPMTVPINSFVDVNTMRRDDSDFDSPQIQKKIGFVRVITSRLSMYEKLTLLSLKLFLTLLLVVLVGAVFSYLFSRRLASSMEEMSEAAIKISGGHFYPKFKQILPGEFGFLQTSFLEMARRIGDFTTQLENKVSQRTEDLQKQKLLVERANQEKKLLIQRNNQAIENERKNIAFDLHDTLNTIVLSLIGNARQTANYLKRFDHNNLMTTPLELLTTIEKNANFLYSLSRDLVTNLRPEVLDEFGLGEALGYLISKHSESHDGCVYTYHHSKNFPRLNYDFNIVIYRIVQESLANITKHAKATLCNIDISCELIDDIYSIQLLIEDNGVGFDLQLPTGRTGLVGMKERADGINADLSMVSKVGIGTQISLDVFIKKNNF
ncbi:hypothetical protein QN372_19640 [Undibacterium sp. RTI2.1]|uniref:hypothetical protein n=1 Tax=unclassified Undibacterium TaxID=2630295 RepID=UPI002B22B9D6|nr:MULTISPECIES: hypothetical protein [unclassified Undibacterium]MEB0032965.1 hypothetical protein [Undibacterium sp. RTI2.1]MEB0118724.1 hypothetical protein [Undibacterium sp. RTI2.2]